MRRPRDSSFPSPSLHTPSLSLSLSLPLLFCFNSTARLALPTLEALTMHNYWRTSGGTGGRAATFFTGNPRPATNNTLIPAAIPFSDYGFDGPFFDLEFTLSNDHEPSETTETENGSGNSSETDQDMREIELNLDIDDQDFKISPFYKRNLLPVPPSSSNDSEDNSKSLVSLLKSAEKFRDLLLKLKKLNSSNGGEKSEKTEATDNKLVRVKFKVDEVKGPLISLFARDITFSEDSSTNSANLGKEMLQKYLNILKPLYLGVEKMRLHGGGGPNCSPPTAMAKSGMRSNNNLQAGLKVVRKHLGKSRSTSAASPPVSNRRDDSLLELHDGIQGAILHCKRSFKSNREGESAIYSRSVSDPYCEKSVISSASHSDPAIETVV